MLQLAQPFTQDVKIAKILKVWVSVFFEILDFMSILLWWASWTLFGAMVNVFQSYYTAFTLLILLILKFGYYPTLQIQ